LLLHHLLRHHLLRADVLRSARLPQCLRDVRGAVPCVLRSGECVLRSGECVQPGELLRSVRERKLSGRGRQAERFRGGSWGASSVVCVSWTS
jgi:hypothetical protein